MNEKRERKKCFDNNHKLMVFPFSLWTKENGKSHFGVCVAIAVHFCGCVSEMRKKIQSKHFIKMTKYNGAINRTEESIDKCAI